jgi:hypothetical protein
MIIGMVTGMTGGGAIGPITAMTTVWSIGAMTVIDAGNY